MTPEEEQVEMLLREAALYAQQRKDWQFKLRHAILDEPVDREVMSFWIAGLPSPWGE